MVSAVNIVGSFNTTEFNLSCFED